MNEKSNARSLFHTDVERGTANVRSEIIIQSIELMRLLKYSQEPRYSKLFTELDKVIRLGVY